MMKSAEWRNEATKDLLKQLNDAKNYEPVETTLYTSERVLARVTDGIYRLPSSALRELISNAYDADASIVEIQTNPPRFDEIVIQDNGNGLTLEALTYLIHNIGGSAKRTTVGKDLSICSESDPLKSPGGRKLIGKIGIGLFSVSQLTKEFQIITKRSGNEFRIVADVILKTHSEDHLADGEEFSTGDVKIWRVPAADIEGHGTRIVLRNLLNKTQDQLRSKDAWMKAFPEEYDSTKDMGYTPTLPPHYHIGRIDADAERIITPAVLPWDTERQLGPAEKFKAIVESILALRAEITKPSIKRYFDNYFQMIWNLSLAVPVNYVQKHPFDMTTSEMRIFELSNEFGGQAQEVSATNDTSIREKLNLTSPERGGKTDFHVIVDGIELHRPICFTGLPQTAKSMLSSLMFVGRGAPDLSQIPQEVRGGDLEFEAYFLWNSVIAPKENAGILIRINDAAGMAFDESFLEYPRAETIRLQQVSAEIFVKKGLDAALNIDRESFNFAHPHYQYIAAWVHNAFRQLANRQKELSSELRTQKKLGSVSEFNEAMRSIVESVQTKDDYEDSEVILTDKFEDVEKLRKNGTLAYNRREVLADPQLSVSAISSEVESKVKAIILILDRMNLLDSLSFSDQQKLVAKITAVISK